MTLFDAFQDQLKISVDTYFSMLRSRLELELSKSDFAEDGIEEDENQDLSGRARFLIRKLRERGWLDYERGEDFKEYIVIPEYSIRILELFHWLMSEETPSGFSYVYESYATLKSANEESSSHYEKLTALNGAYDKTLALIKILKTVYHNINRYFQAQIDLVNVNKVLEVHFDDFLQRIVETHIRPLKIKDSVPKYKIPIIEILDSWLENNDILQGMAQATMDNSRLQADRIDYYRGEIIQKVFFVKESYERIEQEYIGEIDNKIRKYTRTTIQKIEILTNHDKTVRGNIIYLLNEMAQQPKNEDLTDRVQDVIQLRQQKYLTENGLYSQRRGRKRVMQNPVLVEDTGQDLTPLAQKEFAGVLNSPYTKKRVFEYMEQALCKQPVTYMEDFMLENDEQYILSLLAVMQGEDRMSPYKTTLLEDKVRKGIYAIPQVRFEAKEEE